MFLSYLLSFASERIVFWITFNGVNKNRRQFFVSYLVVYNYGKVLFAQVVIARYEAMTIYLLTPNTQTELHLGSVQSHQT
mgnify:CR=1 FL=1